MVLNHMLHGHIVLEHMVLDHKSVGAKISSKPSTLTSHAQFNCNEHIEEYHHVNVCSVQATMVTLFFTLPFNVLPIYHLIMFIIYTEYMMVMTM